MIVHTTMVLCLQLALFGILLPGVNCKALPVKSCTDDQYKRILANGSTVCVDCLRCPMGLGPSVECGSTISVDTKIHCEMCRTGSFSPYNDYEQCQSCRVCSEDQVSKPCTSSSDTICEKKCISKGKYYEKSSDDCKDCTWCCGDGKDIVIDECLKKGMPSQKSCTIHRKKLCKPPPVPTIIASTALPTILPLKTTTVQPTAKKTTEDKNINNWHLREPTRRKPSNHSHYQHSHIKNSSSVNRIEQTKLQVLVGVCCGLASLLAVSLVFMLIIYRKKRCGFCMNSTKESQGKLEVVYTSNEDEVKIIDTHKERRLFEIFKNDHKLKDVVCHKLDLKKSFASLARCCKMDEDNVKKLLEHPGNEPTHQVFDWIEGVNPDFSFGDFTIILKEIRRKDVLKCCVEKLKMICVQLESK